MMEMGPFTWGAGGEKLTPAQAAARRKVAESLMTSGTAPKSFGEGLNRVGEALVAKSFGDQATAADAAHGSERQAIMDALLGNPDPTMQDIYGALGNDVVTSDPGSIAVLEALMGQEAQQNDPLRQLQIQQAQQGLEMGNLEIEGMRNPPAPAPDYGFMELPDGTIVRTDSTSGGVESMGQFGDPAADIPDSVEALDLRAQRAGLVPGTPEYNDFMIKGGAGNGTTINNMGNIPAGYTVEYDDQGRPVTMSPVPGSPAALEADAAAAKLEMREDQATITSDTILNEAGKARGLISGWSTGPGQWVLGNLPFTQAAELNRHVSSLKAIASSENINMMRQSSPTGAAMGNTSDADLKLLQDKAGALDPQSSNFPEMLDDYERTLLRIVHGPKVGDAIFDQTRGLAPGAGAPIDEPPEGISPEEWQFLTPEERALWQN